MRQVQGARGLVGRIANNAVMTTTATSSYSTDKHHDKREYRRQRTDSRDVQHKKKTVDKKVTLDEKTRQEIIAEENRVPQLS